MEDIGLNMARGLERHVRATDHAHHVTAHDDLFSDDASGDASPRADDDESAVDVPVDLAIDLRFAGGDDIARNGQIGSEHGGDVALAA